MASRKSYYRRYWGEKPVSQLKLDTFARKPKKLALDEIISRFHDSAIFVEPPLGPCDMCGEIKKLWVHITLRARSLSPEWEHLFICAKCALNLPSKLKPCGDELLITLRRSSG